MKITKCVDKFDYFINFNRKYGMTTDSSEGKNNIIITKIQSSSSYEDSQLVATLDEGEEYVTKALKGTE